MKSEITQRSIPLIVIFFLSMLLSACGTKAPTLDIDAQKTGFAQTADVQATKTAASQPTATKTLEPSPTFTATLEVTQTPAQSPTPAVSATAITSIGVDAASWRANDPPDNTEIEAGKPFTVTWTIENTGTSTWTINYFIEFASGEQMGAENKTYLPYPAAPGTNVQISVDFVAPESEGTKQSNWRLVNQNNEPFFEFYVIIKVKNSGN